MGELSASRNLLRSKGSKASFIKDLGDFQTPSALVTAVIECLGPIGKKWPRVLEPTCGCGNFIAGLLTADIPPREIQAIELQDVHFESARKFEERSSSTRVLVTKANLFDLDLRKDLQWNATGPLLVVGNPPWVTNSDLGALSSGNLPRKSNIKGLRGIDALTGESNFDIAESIWLKLIKELAPEQPTIALLCKTSVARNIVTFAHRARLPIVRAVIHKVDARKWFGVSTDACLLSVKVGPVDRPFQLAIYSDLRATEPQLVTATSGGALIADLAAYERSSFADGTCLLKWRQGVKHDAAPVMELSLEPVGLRNNLGEIVDVEPEYVYPLIKSSDLFHGRQSSSHRSVILTQKRLGEETAKLEKIAPKLWAYLSSHAVVFTRRKSSVYEDQPKFAIFGVGDYTFAPYKVGISGLYKTPRFRAIGPVVGRPAILDDTCYFVPCCSRQQAALLACLLNDPVCLDLIHAAVFWDAKRPITKKVLQRIDLKELLKRALRQELLSLADKELERLPSVPGEEMQTWPSNLEPILLQDFSLANASTMSLFN